MITPCPVRPESAAANSPVQPAPAPAGETPPGRLRGVVPPMVTPLTTPSDIDGDGTRRLVARLLDTEAHGVFILGTTGEGPNLTPSMKREFIDIVCAEVDERIPVVVAVSDPAVEESVRLARYAAERGAAACASTPPFYFGCTQEEIAAFYRHLAERSPLPLLVYDIPAMSKSHVVPDTFRRLLEIKNVAGIKDSSSDMIVHHQLLSLRRQSRNFTLLMGPEELLADAVLFGSDGGVCGGANVFPQLFVDLYDAALRADMPAVIALQNSVMDLHRMYALSPSPAGVVQTIKAALHLLGVCSDTMTTPYAPYPDEHRCQLENLLRANA